MTTAEKLLAPKEAAHLLRCSPLTIYRAISRGELQAVRLGPNGSLRITETALERFLRPASSPAEGDTPA
jgi:excisionase family DNA binding protein